MKTIKQGLDEAYKKAGHNAYFGNGFNAGVEFSQRWIPVEEELPPCSDSDILLKGVDDRGIKDIVDVGYMHDSSNGKPNISNFIGLGGVLVKITHWRPIEHS